MSASAGASLPHRAISNIRAGDEPTKGPAAPASPHTPLRTLPSTFSSPSSIRAEEDVLIVEVGSRKLQAGFAGDAVPKAHLEFRPEHERRIGDFRVWEAGYQDDWRKRATGKDWGRDHELWRSDVRGLDMTLISDKIERALREALTKYLLIDSRPRRMVVVLPSGTPIPLLSSTLDTLFARFQAPNISLFSSSAASAVAAGVRSALVVDLGWQETAVTSVYEYREVQCSRSVRAGRMLVEQTHKLLKAAMAGAPGGASEEGSAGDVVSFEECEDVACRMVWCKPAKGAPQQQQVGGLPTLAEQDEPEHTGSGPAGDSEHVTIPLNSAFPPTTVDVTYDQLAEPCEATFFESQYAPASFDDDELPIPLLVYRSLLQLPMDVRALCMSRIIFTGGCASVLGLRGRIFDEVAQLVQERGWDPVRGKGVEQLRANTKLQRRGARQPAAGPAGVSQPADGGGDQDGVWHDAANAAPEVDPIEAQLRDGTEAQPGVQGRLRAIESLGPWSGASLLSQLKVPAVATVDRELWLQQGAAGASKPSEVDFKAQQRQSLGAGGLIRGAPSGTNWTLGVWGVLP